DCAAEPVGGEQSPQELALADEMPLPDELLERSWAHPHGERLHPVKRALALLREKVDHRIVGPAYRRRLAGEACVVAPASRRWGVRRGTGVSPVGLSRGTGVSPVRGSMVDPHAKHKARIGADD